MIIEGLILAIVGDRNYTDYHAFQTIIDKVNSPIHAIVSGGAKGADTMAERYAMNNNIDMIIHVAEWDTHGKAAGPIRNRLIVNDADAMIAFLAPGSRGTANSIKLAQEKGIPVHIIHVS